MSSKALVCLLALALVSACGAFAAAPELIATPAVDQPMPVEDFLEALGNGDPSQPVDKLVINCTACSSDHECLVGICNYPGFCGARCRFVSTCGWSACDCLDCS